jgi:exopolysaccharide biosynthesis polyprenyl glycosylphosphotransferase
MSMVLDYGFSMLALIVAVAMRPSLQGFPWLVPVESVQIPLYLYFLIPFVWVSVFAISSVYDPMRNLRIVDEIITVVIASALVTLVLAGLLFFLHRDFSRWLFVIFVALNLTFLLCWRLVARHFRRIISWPQKERRILVVGAGEVGQQVEEMLEQFKWEGLTFCGFMDDDKKYSENSRVLGDLNETRAFVAKEQITDVIITLPQRANGKISDLIVDLRELPVHVRVVPDYFSLALHRATVDTFGDLPMINLREPALNKLDLTVKRGFDLLFGGILTFISLPLMGLLAVLIKLDSPGPAWFKQQRVGENGRLFTMYKFRSMIDGAETLQHNFVDINEEGEILFKKKDDPRITRLGQFTRRTSLDELPQLFNVLRGDMSLVGPRPELPWLVKNYEPWQRKRFAVPQGMTGLWQVNGRSNRPMHLNVTDDLYYIENYSFWLDLYILFKTVLIVLRGTGAY